MRFIQLQSYIILFFAILVTARCENPTKGASDFIPNVPPEIRSVTDDIIESERAYIATDNIIRINVEAYDANGHNLKFYFISDQGKVVMEHSSRSSCVVDFKVGPLLPGQNVSVNVKVVDQKGESDSVRHNLGTGKGKPLIQLNDGYTGAYLSDENATIDFSAAIDCNASYKSKVIQHGNQDRIIFEDTTWHKYEKGDILITHVMSREQFNKAEKTIRDEFANGVYVHNYVYYPDGEEALYSVHITVKDTMDQTTSAMVPFCVDFTSPHTTLSKKDVDALEPVDVTFMSSDDCQKVVYNICGPDEDICLNPSDNNLWPVISDFSSPLVVGNRGPGKYVLIYRGIDLANNIEGPNIASFYILDSPIGLYYAEKKLDTSQTTMLDIDYTVGSMKVVTLNIKNENHYNDITIGNVSIANTNGANFFLLQQYNNRVLAAQENSKLFLLFFSGDAGVKRAEVTVETVGDDSIVTTYPISVNVE